MFTKDVETYLTETIVTIRLGVLNQSGWPLVVSLWYIYRNGAIYLATRESARVVEWLRANPKCGFEIASDEPPYCGVRGQARAVIDRGLGKETLYLLLERYLGGTDSSLAQNLISRASNEVAIRLEVENHFTWNFQDRMKDIAGNSVDKICPD